MQIDFYEEFPSEINLRKLRLIKFKSRVFIAGKDLNEFEKVERRAKKINRKLRFIYWPIIKNSYWISPFSNKKDLLELFHELSKYKGKILIDLEFPLKRSLIIKNLFNIGKNKKLIREFLEKNKDNIITAQYPPSVFANILRLFGLDYNIVNEKQFMCYSSSAPEIVRKHVEKNLMEIKNKENYTIVLGTIATGILGNEKILAPSNLKKDLQLVKNIGFNRVVIFRLGGLNKEYLKIINKFVRH